MNEWENLDNLNEKYEVFENHIAKALNKHALIRPLTKKESRARVKPFGLQMVLENQF